MLHVDSTPSLEFHPEKVLGAKCSGDSLIFFISFCPPIILCSRTKYLPYNYLPQVLSIYDIPLNCETLKTEEFIYLCN